MRPDPPDLIHGEVGPAKEPPTFPAIAFHGLHFLILAALALISIRVEIRMGRGRPWPFDPLQLHHLVILCQGPILYGLDLALRRLGYKSLLKKPQAQSTREVWARLDAGLTPGPGGKLAGPDGAAPGAIVLATDLQILAGLGVSCLAGALMFAVVIAMAHAISPQVWTAGIGWAYACGATLAILGSAGLWCGLATCWETRFDGFGITRVRFDRIRFTPWSAIGGVTILRHAASDLGPDTTLSFRDRDGRRLGTCPIARRHAAEVGRLLALMRDRLPDLRPDPLAEDVA